MKKDNLFDLRLTPLDFVKAALLFVTMFSSYNIADLITPDVPFAFIRELAMVAVVEGAFIGFEFATRDAKTKEQTQYATVGFFCSLFVLILFMGVSGLIEFGGPSLLAQSGGDFMGIAWKVKDWVMLVALSVASGWLFLLAALYRLYDMADPDKRAQLERNRAYGAMQTARNQALAGAMLKAQPVISLQAALAQIRADYANDLSPVQLDALLADVEAHLRNSLHGVAAPAAPVSSSQPAAVRPVRSVIVPVPEPVLVPGGNGKGNGHPTL